MTESELHLTMTSGFSTIAGSVLSAYISLGVPPQNLVTSSVMSIPASIAISKMRFPEVEEPVTRGQVVVDRGHEEKHPPVSGSQSGARHVLKDLFTRQTLSMLSVTELYSVSLLPARFCRSSAPIYKSQILILSQDERAHRPVSRCRNQRPPDMDWTRLWHSRTHTPAGHRIHLLPRHLLPRCSPCRDPHRLPPPCHEARRQRVRRLP